MPPLGFLKAADLKDLVDGKSFEVEVGPLPLFLHRRGDQVFATGVYCAHQDFRLNPANCSGDTILCTAHGYRMNIRTGACLNEDDLFLPTYPTLIENGEVWVKLH
jgi:nitrite reductase/ring-hydroxylating ferredoxin subunit